MLSEVLPLIESGGALHWLRPREKAPVASDWSNKPVASADLMRRTYRDGYNVGIRLGEPSKIGAYYLHLIDLDIRDDAAVAEARSRLAALWPGYPSFPTVVSGSGGASRHYYFLTDQPFRSKKLAHSPGFSMVFDEAKGRDVKKWDWEIELFGTGKQAAMPPSIHPSGKPYAWERPLDLSMVEFGVGPIVPADLVEAWGASVHEDVDPDADVKPPLGLTTEEAWDLLEQLPIDGWCEDRDGWLNVGMALHHEFDGSDDGLELWNEFSRQSEKFDEKDQARVWKSFRSKSNSIRMATIKKAVAQERLMAQFDDVDAFDSADVDEAETVDVETPLDDEPADEIADLLGGGEPSDEDLLADLVVPAVERASADQPNPNWRSLLDLTEEKATVKSTLHNLELIVRNDPRIKGLPRKNLFSKEVVNRDEPGKLTRRNDAKRPKALRQLRGPVWDVRDPVNGDLWSSSMDAAVRSVIEAPVSQGGYGVKVPQRDLKDAINLVAVENGFHPVREYLTGLTWDETPRVDSMFVRFLGAPDSSYTRSVARMLLVAAVTRAFEPGHKFDFAVILEGLQGKRKSTFISILARNWFAELDGDFHEPKVMVELMQGAWILEIPELSGFGRADVRAIKAFISRTTDKVRLAFEPRAEEFPRQCVFVGSTNDREYLRDDTGGRRFWPVECRSDEIDTAAFDAEVDQLWAEAYVIYRAMRAEQPFGTLPLYLTDAEAQIEALAMQEARRVESAEDATAGRIAAWLDRPIDETEFVDVDPVDDLLGPPAPKMRNVTCLTQIWAECLGNDLRFYKHAESLMLGRAMKGVAGWYSDGGQGTFPPPYGKQRKYVREGSSGIDGV